MAVTTFMFIFKKNGVEVKIKNKSRETISDIELSTTEKNRSTRYRLMRR